MSIGLEAGCAGSNRGSWIAGVPAAGAGLDAVAMAHAATNMDMATGSIPINAENAAVIAVPQTRAPVCTDFPGDALEGVVTSKVTVVDLLGITPGLVNSTPHEA